MPIDRYMGLCLGHPQHGYYMARDPFGAAGDFVTAPEVSQIFGELLGVWCVAAWQAMGSPASVHLVELGPGRGTLMADMLRAARQASPDFLRAARVHLVETSPGLQARQRDTIGDGAEWHAAFETVPAGPLIVIANEFFDAIPIRQFEKRDGAWHERTIGVVDGKLRLGLVPAALGEGGADGDIIEFAPARTAIARELGERLSCHTGVSLIIDYGHFHTAPGDTFQAVRSHRKTSVLDSPGESDLTSHVDFEALGKALSGAGAVVHPALTQRAFLLAMGIEQRTQMLAVKADVQTAAVLTRQTQRLAAPDQMGNLFKVLCAASPQLPTPYPFGHR